MSRAKHERAFKALTKVLRNHGWPIDDEDNPAEMRKALDAYLAVMREPGPGEVRVRACVTVCEDPEIWSVTGFNGEDSELRDVSLEGMEEYAAQHHFANINVPAWKPVTETEVEGEVCDEA